MVYVVCSRHRKDTFTADCIPCWRLSSSLCLQDVEASCSQLLCRALNILSLRLSLSVVSTLAEPVPYASNLHAYRKHWRKPARCHTLAEHGLSITLNPTPKTNAVLRVRCQLHLTSPRQCHGVGVHLLISKSLLTSYHHHCENQVLLIFLITG